MCWASSRAADFGKPQSLDPAKLASAQIHFDAIYPDLLQDPKNEAPRKDPHDYIGETSG